MSYEFADRLIDLRRSRGLSQEELANTLGLSRQAVSKWERAESAPDIGNLVALAEIYEVSLDELVRGIDGASGAEEALDGAEYDGATSGGHDVERGDGAVHGGHDAERSDDETPVNIEVLDSIEVEIDSSSEGDSANESATGEEVVVEGSSAVESVNAKDNLAGEGAAVDEVYTSENASFERASTSVGTIAEEPPAPGSASSERTPESGSAPSEGIPMSGSTPSEGTPASGSASPFPPPPEGAVPVHPPTAPTNPSRKPKNPLLTFPYALLVVLIYLILGFVFGLWHPGWVLFLTIPFYYWIASVITHDPEYEARHRDYYGHYDANSNGHHGPHSE